MQLAEHILLRLRRLAYEVVDAHKTQCMYVRAKLAAELCATGYVTHDETLRVTSYTLVRLTMNQEQAVAFLLAYPEDTP